jgi:alkanesulfonate monooxygenase SsuD/methylene tetrahydromethanopterin reductase-like flavin-dependent oxidoreductase (luciferase family)
VRFAVGIPNLGPYADPERLADLARLAEEAGWDGVFCWDHLSRHGEPATDPQVALAAMAVATRQVRIGAMVTPLARRRPAKVARETVALDRLSGGRLVLGVGLGSRDDEEFGSFGDPADRVERGRMLDEALDVVTALWTGQPLAHDGVHYRAHTSAGFRPVPVQQPRIPIWVAGTWPAKPAFRRAARYDGLFPTFRGVELGQTVTPAELAEAVAYAQAHRDPGLPRLEVAVEGCTPSPAPLAAYAEAGLTWWVESLGGFRGSPSEVERLVAAGPPA